MSISKRKYLPFRIEDMTGGINVRDYASEIENKQAVDLVNWNFDGNKLISEKGVEDTEIASAPSPIGTLKIDNEDLWTVLDNSVYKNGIEQGSKNGARLKVSGLTKAYEQEINDPNGETISYTESEFEYFPDGVKYYVNIDGTDYGATGNSKQDIYNNLKELIEDDGYIASIASEYIYITSENPITITTPSYITYVLYLKTLILNSDYIWTDGWVKGLFFNINGYKDFYYDNKRLSNYGNTPIEYDKAIRDELYNKIEALSIPNIDISKSFLSPGFLEDGTGTIYGKENEAGYAAVILQKASVVEFSRYIPNSFGDVGLNDTLVVVNWSSPSPGDTVILNQGKPNEIVIDLVGEGISSSSDFENWLKNNGYPNTKVIYGKWGGQGTTPGDEFGYIPLDINNNTASPVNTNSISSSDIYPGNWYGLEEDAFNIDTNTFENTPVLSELPNLGRADITIGNMGELIVDKDNGGAYYFTDDVLYGIGDDSVGLPTVGTIYNGKIVLGGYKGNDNIIFSQTASPSQPLNILNFTDYSAGGQSVSGGDKGVITGMKVGENGLYVFKDNSIWYSNSEVDNPSSFSFNLVFNKITSSGALSQDVITEVGQEIFYLDWKTRSVRRLGYEKELTTLRDTSISGEIENLIKELPEEQDMATSHFSYPYYQLSLSDGQNSSVEYNNGNIYKLNNVHFVYNVENKSWTKRTGIDNMIVSNKGYFADLDGKVYKDFEGNISEEGLYFSKEYTFGDDLMYKKYARFEIVGRIIPEYGETKNLSVEIWIDGEMVDDRIYSSSNGTLPIKEKIDLIDIGQTFQFKLKHSGKGRVEVFDVQIHYKGTNIQPQDFF